MIHLTERSPRVAELRVAGAGVRDRFASLEPVPVVVRLGASRARYTLSQPHAPDEGWTLAMGDGSFAPDEALADDAARSFDAWAAGSAAESHGAALTMLPNGRYWLVRRTPPFLLTPRLELGNELVPMPANARRITTAPGPTIACFGARPDAPPSRAAPLLGIVVFGYTGTSESLGALFFETTIAAGATGVDEPLDALLVLPAEGALVIDALSGFRSDADSERLRAAWAREGALSLATALGESGR